jgi:hypothetical protein
MQKILDALADFLDSLLPRPEPRPIPVRVRDRRPRR